MADYRSTKHFMLGVYSDEMGLNYFHNVRKHGQKINSFGVQMSED